MNEPKIIYEDWHEYERLRRDFEADLDIEKPYFPKLRERIGKLTKGHNPEWAYEISRTITNAICGLSNLADIKSVICHILFDEPDNEEESEIFRMADFSRVEGTYGSLPNPPFQEQGAAPALKR
jgi:hypothetical protein